MKKDYIIVVICIGCIIVSSILLYLDYTAKITHGTSEQIGSITFKRRTAERKYYANVLWETLYKNSPLFNKDTIRTSDKSLSIINLYTGDEIELDENTLIYLDMDKDKTNIDFKSGSLNAKNKNNKSSLNITSGGSVINIQDGAASLSKSGEDGSVKIDVSKGKALVKNKNGSEELSENESASVSGKGISVKKYSVVLKNPSVNKYYIAKDKPYDIDFTWESSNKTGLYLEISPDKTFKNSIIKEKVDGNNLTKQFGPGTYYWRLKSDNGIDSSSEGKFSVLSEEPSTLIYPDSGKEFTFAKNLPSISFTWSGSDNATSYSLEICSDPQMKNVVQKIQVFEKRITLNNLKEGEYFWRVKNNYQFGDINTETESPTGKFKITKTDNILPPELSSPVNDEMISKEDSPSLLFNWKDSSDIDEYTLTLAKDPEMKNIVFNEKTKNNYSKVPNKIPSGKYYWKLSYQNPITGKFESTKPGSFELADKKTKEIDKLSTLDTPSILSPKNNSVINMTLKDSIVFSWQGVPNASHYSFKIYDMSNKMDPVFEVKVTGTNYELKNLSILDKGKFVAEIQALNYKGKDQIGKSQINKTEFTITMASLKKPKIKTKELIFIK